MKILGLVICILFILSAKLFAQEELTVFEDLSTVNLTGIKDLDIEVRYPIINTSKHCIVDTQNFINHATLQLSKMGININKITRNKIIYSIQITGFDSNNNGKIDDDDSCIFISELTFEGFIAYKIQNQSVDKKQIGDIQLVGLSMAAFDNAKGIILKDRLNENGKLLFDAMLARYFR